MLKFFRDSEGLHYYRIEENSDQILHIMSNTDEDITKKQTFNGFSASSLIERNSFCINNIKKDEKHINFQNTHIEIAESEFESILNNAIFELGIYKNSISK